jgi:alpha-glucosidase
MHYHKIHHPVNFRFGYRWTPATHALRLGRERFRLDVASVGADVFRLDVTGPRWRATGSQTEFTPPRGARGGARVGVDRDGTLVVRDGAGRCLLEGVPGRTFGVCGPAWLLQFRHAPDMRFHGMGEKSVGFERSAKSTKFWNTDVWADFACDACKNGQTDPMYASIPYLIVKRGDRFVGLLLDNPHAAFMSTHAGEVATGAQDGRPCSQFYVGSPDGQPALYVIVGPTLPELTRKLQTLVGRTPLPPLWALGHHFNGPDVPGFGGDATRELAVAGYKAGFLFPFFRNHSVKNCRPQEPWTFGPRAAGGHRRAGGDRIEEGMGRWRG